MNATPDWVWHFSVSKSPFLAMTNMGAHLTDTSEFVEGYRFVLALLIVHL